MRLIDAEHLKARAAGITPEREKFITLYERDDESLEYFANYIDCEPVVDAVKIVRCRDCEYWEHWKPANEDGRKLCEYLDLYERGNWYCASGRKREEEV